MAPSIVIGEDDYAQLRHKERLLLMESMAAIRVRRVVSSDYSWPQDIVALLGLAGATADGAQVLSASA
jgi:hypothetical protein